MYFESFNQLITMNGHGKYVWGCVIFSTVIIAVLFIRALNNHKKQFSLSQKLNRVPKDPG